MQNKQTTQRSKIVVLFSDLFTTMENLRQKFPGNKQMSGPELMEDSKLSGVPASRSTDEETAKPGAIDDLRQQFPTNKQMSGPELISDSKMPARKTSENREKNPYGLSAEDMKAKGIAAGKPELALAPPTEPTLKPAPTPAANTGAVDPGKAQAASTSPTGESSSEGGRRRQRRQGGGGDANVNCLLDTSEKLQALGYNIDSVRRLLSCNF